MEGEFKEREITSEELEKIVDYFVELNVLKETSSSGWRLAGVPENLRDSIAEHITLTAQLAYVLAKMEGLSKKEALICAGWAIFHDNPETRLGDIDRVSAHYLDASSAFPEALKDQVNQLPKEIGDEIFNFVMGVKTGDKQKEDIVNDADILERALKAKILAGTFKYKTLDDFFSPEEEEKLRTDTAKKLIVAIRIKKEIATHWRKGLKVE